MKNLYLIFLALLISGLVTGQQFTLSTYPTITSNNSFDQVLFELTPNKNIILDNISSVFFAGTDSCWIWIKPGGYSSPPGTIGTSTGWTLIGATIMTVTATTVPTLIPLTLNYPLQANTTYGISVSGGLGALGAQYHTHVATDPNFYTDANVSIEIGAVKGWAGAWPTPINTPRDFVGSVVYTVAASVPNDAGVTEIVEPLTGCVGLRDVKVEVSNKGTNQITNVTVHWSINGVFQTPYIHNQLLDTANGVGPSSAVVTLGSANFVNTGNYNIRAWTVLPNAVNDTVNYNDTSDISLTGVNYPTGSLGLDTTICPGEPITLTASSSNPDSTRWNDNSTLNSRIVGSAGYYKVSIYKSGCRTDDSINVSLYPAPPTVNLGNDTTICYGDVLTLDATAPGVTYTWHDNSTSSTYPADTSGFYSVIIEDANTCKNGDTIQLYLFQEPKVTLFVSPGTTICYGAPFIFTANGTTAGSKMYQLVVNGVNVGSPQVGNTFSSPPINYGDTVRVDMLTDQCATSEYAVPSNSLVMFIKPEPRLINALTADTVLENTSKNYALSPIANNGYLWRVSGGSINGDSTTFAVKIDWDGPNPNAWVSVTERDATNCSYENILPVNVISIEGISESENGYLGNAYPNPANKSITIPVSSKVTTDIQLGLYDLTGKEMRMIYSGSLNGSRNFVLDVSDLNEGMYFYKLVTSEGRQSSKKISIIK